MSDPLDFAAMLGRLANAYPTTLFPVPPPEDQAKDAAAAHVLREVACPTFAEAAEVIRSLVAERERFENSGVVASLRAERDAALARLDAAEARAVPDGTKVATCVCCDGSGIYEQSVGSAGSEQLSCECCFGLGVSLVPDGSTDDTD
jgi:hypothetical protein